MFSLYVRFVIAVAIAQALAGGCGIGSCSGLTATERLRRSMKTVLQVDWKPIRVFEK